jgi:hypothetical protein
LCREIFPKTPGKIPNWLAKIWIPVDAAANLSRERGLFETQGSDQRSASTGAFWNPNCGRRVRRTFYGSGVALVRLIRANRSSRISDSQVAAIANRLKGENDQMILGPSPCAVGQKVPARVTLGLKSAG